MLFNYLKIAFRSLKKRKGFTAINIIGLALGLATCMLIVYYVADELSYDQYHIKADRIFRINNDIKFGGNEKSYTTSPAPLAGVLMQNYPQVETVVRFREKGAFNVRKGAQDIQEHRVVFVDSTLFSVFTLGMIEGDAGRALVEPRTVVINETTAKKYFDDVHAVGKTLLLDDSIPYKVTGVIHDMPVQSHFNFDLFLSMASLEEGREEAWLSNNFVTYVLLKPDVKKAAFEPVFAQIMRKYAGPQLQSLMHLDIDAFERSGNYYRMNLTPVKEIHLHSNRVGEMGRNGNMQYVYIFSVIAAFILLIACVNFMNLSTARSANRAREVGVRKVLGSPRKQLIAQFLSESILITFVAAILAVLVAALLMPLFNHVSGKNISISVQSLKWLVPALLLTVIVVGCVAGSYPAFFLSGFQPVEVLKGKLSAGFKGGRLRSLLVVFQFAISVFLIIGTLVIYNQIAYIRNKDLGYNREQMLVVHHLGDLGNNAEVFKQEVKKIQGVSGATMTGFLPTSSYRNSTVLFRSAALEHDKAISSQVWVVDESYVPTLGIQLKAGRNFSQEMGMDSLAIIVNETAARMMGGNALQQELIMPQDNMLKTTKTYHVIGVIKDFNFSSLRDNITPLTLFYGRENTSLTVKVSGMGAAGTIDRIKAQWSSLAPHRQFDYTFMDEDFDADYRAEQRVSTISVAFTTLAIVIACLGLFGLAAYAAEQRTKEIGIRKVLGANVRTIVTLLSADFIKLVVIAILVATPLAWLAMHEWLQGFAYRQNIQWWIVGLAAVASVGIALVTISFQSIKAALTNPVKSLKSE
ncbi:putative ABC transport system permease protein [Filimonas lacunae]|uniref:Putative ABC transport system permease protein n=1 Tax=Filimonas lacunae TaxID=477680 RepID=A0A173MLX4_9BACT|nr:ABC transporter permease [Filimonas lacunae]BAV08653.1 ABC transporter, permease protein [Filimonas lacunae]SIS59318.1 putative ABC transport system permease protein [Filimonas lacunae]